MQIEVTDEMREAVRRAKEAQGAYDACTPANFIETLTALMDARTDLANLVIAAIEKGEGKNGT